MSTLIKNRSYTYILGTSGTSAIPGVPNEQGTPAHYSTEEVTVTSCAPTICNTTTIAGSDSLIGSSIGSGGYREPAPCARAMVCHTETVRESVYHPATPGTPGTTGTPGTSVTPGQLIEHLNEGWNSYSRSVEKLTLEKYIKYRVNAGVGGVMISIGVQGMEKSKITEFSHSVLVETAGVLVFENGVKKSTVKNSYSESSDIRLYRQPDNKIVCTVTTGAETLVHVFDNVGHSSALTPLYVYANLYIADDSVEDATYKTGKVSFGKV